MNADAFRVAQFYTWLSELTADILRVAACAWRVERVAQFHTWPSRHLILDHLLKNRLQFYTWLSELTADILRVAACAWRVERAAQFHTWQSDIGLPVEKQTEKWMLTLSEWYNFIPNCLTLDTCWKTDQINCWCYESGRTSCLTVWCWTSCWKTDWTESINA